MQQKKRGSIRRVSCGVPDPDLVERLMNNKQETYEPKRPVTPPSLRVGLSNRVIVPDGESIPQGSGRKQGKLNREFSMGALVMVKKNITTKARSVTKRMTERMNHRGSISVEEHDSDENQAKLSSDVPWYVKFFSGACEHGGALSSHGAYYVKMKWGIIHPHSTAMAFWNVAMAVFVLLCVGFIPWQLAFGYTTDLHGSVTESFWAVAMPVMDVYFLIDIFVQFRVAFTEDGELAQRPDYHALTLHSHTVLTL
jgi:hypothetical protein